MSQTSVTLDMKKPSCENFIFIYTTQSDLDSAQKISRKLLEKKLIACANIFPEVESIYLWEGKENTSKERVVIFKTKKELFSAVETEILKLSTNSVPAIVQLKIEDGHRAFLKWIDESTKTDL